MKKYLYLVRHGQTLFNSLSKIQGWCDSPLTELGINQAKVAGQWFKDNNVNIENAYCSTSERTSDTLEQIWDGNYKRIKGLKEWNFGRLEGEREIVNPQLPYKDFFVYYGGEAELDFQERVSSTIIDLMQKDKNQNILMVSHGAACAQFFRKWLHKSKLKNIGKLTNCCILKFEFENDEFTMVDYIEHDFSKIMKEK